MASRICLSFSIISDRRRRNSPSGTYEGFDSIPFQPFDNFLSLIKPFSNASQDLWFDLDVERLPVRLEKELCGSVGCPPISAVECMSFRQLNQKNSSFPMDIPSSN